MRILVVDDSMMSRMILMKNISAAAPGAVIDQASNGQQGVDMVRLSVEKNAVYNIVFLDCLMPIVDGIQALRQIRGIDPERPVVMVTANIQNKIKEEAEELKCMAFLNKTGDSAAIAAILKSLEGA
jgi:DNA-binding NarL/FixJ family response regulator